MPSLTTFNANNFFLRYKFSGTYPGDLSKKSLIEAADAATMGYLPEKAFGTYPPDKFIIWDADRRRLAATALREPDGQLPDILCLQEVETMDALRAFNETYLGKHYPYTLLIDGWDPRNIDVGILSVFPIVAIRSHIDETTGGKRIFSRDCLEVVLALQGNDMLTVFLNHLKSKLVMRKKNENDTDFEARVRESHGQRKLQAQTVAAFVEERLQGKHETALYAVVGDFNDTPYSPYVEPLVASGRLTDIVTELRGEHDSWTYYWRDKNRVSHIDFILTSKALTQRVRERAGSDPGKKPHIERAGLAYKTSEATGAVLPPYFIHFEEDAVTPAPWKNPPEKTKVPFDFPRYEDVANDWKKNISDHCPVKIWF